MTRTLKHPTTELSEFADASTARFAEAFFDLARGIVSQAGTAKYELGMRRVRKAAGEAMTLADLFGRRRVMLELDAADDKASADLPGFSEMGMTLSSSEQLMLLDCDTAAFSTKGIASPLPTIPFEDALSDILGREPRLAETAESVAELYRDRFSFAVARSADEKLTERIQSAFASLTKRGETRTTQAKVLAEIGDFTRGYANTVYRTNLNTAYTAGRFKQAQDPVVMSALPAMERFSVGDSAVRRGRRQDHGENHLAAHGLVMATRDPRWSYYATPSGYG